VDNNYSGVRRILSLFAIKIRSCTEDFTAHDISNAVFGLQNMSPDCFEVRSVLIALGLESEIE
jgi:hypothetical protein